MYISVLEIDGHEFKGTMDMYVLKKVQEDLLKNGEITTIPNIFLKISKFDMLYISSFVLNTLSRINEEDSKKFLEIYLEYDEDELKVLNRFNSIFTYINDIMAKCLPKNQNNKEESIFEDDYLLYEDKDWELDYMEYIWNSIICRNDSFWCITPKNYFEQLEIYKKFNNIKDEKVEVF
ncbi:Uncharacterised protein [uncultured Clostridium sp.]|nr:Uncharacterised protein [uncultured Clostridium sp.]